MTADDPSPRGPVRSPGASRGSLNRLRSVRGGRLPLEARPAAEAEALEELRSLLTEPERERLKVLETRGPVDAEAVAAVLPEAIIRRDAADDRIGRALEQTVEEGLFRSARKDPKALADAIHPALGPAIRSMIQASLRQSLESLNVALENSLSPQGLKWRITAARTGKSFSEVVLLETLVYRVEQVLLVQRASGLIMGEVQAPGTSLRDSDLVAGMLSAIRDFAEDSFGASPEDAPLEEIELRGLTLILAQGQEAVLALVVRGNPPRTLHERASETIERLHVDYGEAMAEFTGDEAELEFVEPDLEDLLEQEAKKREPNKLVRLLPVALAALALGWLSVSAWRSHRAGRDLGRVTAALGAAEGIVVTDARLVDGGIAIEGLRDPVSDDPQEIAHKALVGFRRPVTLSMSPFASLEPLMVSRRIRQMVEVPVNLRLDVKASVLYVSGGTEDDRRALRATLRTKDLGLLGIDRVASDEAPKGSPAAAPTSQ